MDKFIHVSLQGWCFHSRVIRLVEISGNLLKGLILYTVGLMFIVALFLIAILIKDPNWFGWGAGMTVGVIMFMAGLYFFETVNKFLKAIENAEKEL